MDLGTKLSELRKSRKLTQKEVATILEIETKEVSNFEHNLTEPTKEQLINLAKIYDIDLEVLTTDNKMLKVLIIIFKCFIVFFVICLVFLLFFFLLFGSKVESSSKTNSIEINCTLNNESYEYILTSSNDQIKSFSGDSKTTNELNLSEINSANELMDTIDNYFTNKSGNCNISVS